MKHVFYLIGIGFMIYELLWLLDPKSQVERSKKLKDEAEKNKGRKWDDYTDEYKGLLKNKGLPAFTIILWMFVGLFTFNWFAFLSKIAFNFIVIAPISKLTQFSWAYTCLHWLNSLAGFSFGVFVILNSYHLKIDLYAWFLTII